MLPVIPALIFIESDKLIKPTPFCWFGVLYRDMFLHVMRRFCSVLFFMRGTLHDEAGRVVICRREHS